MSDAEVQVRAEPHIPFVTSGAYPVREGNLVRPLVDGEPAFRRICEAVEAARRSVWVTVAFLDPDFEMPDGRGSLFDVLDRAAARGVEVKALFWRVNPEAAFEGDDIFSGDAEQLRMLQARRAAFHARWDRAQKAYCQHQKSWLIDAGEPGEIAFVGGINLNTNSVAAPGHAGERERSTHDVYVELQGPAATDVTHNFVQRWNEASERAAADGCFGHDPSEDLPFPSAVSPAKGEALVQIQRTVRAGSYTNGRATPGGADFPIAQGELSVFDQYRRAIGAARRTIYIENQALGTPEVVEDLHEALRRGVIVICLVPAEVNVFMRQARRNPQSKAFFDRLGALGKHAGFTLAGIAARRADGIRRNVYVHAKAMLIDDAWATIGSCNIGGRSFFGDTELNASFWAPDVVRGLRCQLFAEHLEEDTSAMEDVGALRFYADIARENARRLEAGNDQWQGIAFALDPATYGE